MRRARTSPPEEIFVRRESGYARSVALLGCLVGTGLLGAGRYLQWFEVAYETVVYAFGAGLALGPIAGVFAGWRVRRRLAATAESDELRKRLRVVALAEQGERRSFSMRVAVAMAYAPALIACGLALADGVQLERLGKALTGVFTFGWPMINALLFSGYAYMSRLTGKEQSGWRSLLGRAITPMLWSGGSGVLAALLAGLDATTTMAVVLFGAAAAFGVFVPTTWWAGRRLRKEREQLALAALPRGLEDSDEMRQTLIRALEWSEGPSTVRVEALRGLAARVPMGELVPHLSRALAGDHDPLVQAALRISITRRHLPALDRLIALAERDDAETLALLPPLLCRHRDLRVEDTLRALFARQPIAVKIAAGEALGLVGSIAVVEELRSAAQEAGPSKLRAICSEAVERIHIRNKGGRGQLALVGGQGSELSYPEEVASGSLSRPE